MRHPEYPPYRPSNGTEGMIFESNWCEQCCICYICRHIRDINFCYDIEDPQYRGDKWVRVNGQPTCLSFHSLKNRKSPVRKIPDDPAQLKFNFTKTKTRKKDGNLH
jgi:hypothetical protein